MAKYKTFLLIIFTFVLLVIIFRVTTTRFIEDMYKPYEECIKTDTEENCAVLYPD